jgi:hypothetical protein
MPTGHTREEAFPDSAVMCRVNSGFGIGLFVSSWLLRQAAWFEVRGNPAAANVCWRFRLPEDSRAHLRRKQHEPSKRTLARAISVRGSQSITYGQVKRH